MKASEKNKGENGDQRNKKLPQREGGNERKKRAGENQ